MSLRHHAPPTVRPALRPPAPAQPSSLARAGTQSGGQSLDRGTQARMSARFGHDFSSVRIHTDSRAEESAQALGANAYALGSDIVFGAGKYLPGSSDTQRLLAHELTHVVQQARSGPGDPSRMSDRADASEREADALAADVTRGRAVQVQAAPGAAVARHPNDMFQPETCLTNTPMNMNFNPNAFNPASGSQATMEPAPQPAGASEPGSSAVWDVTTDNTLGTGTSMVEEGLKAMGRGTGPLGVINKVGGPLGVISNAYSLGDDVRDGHFGNAALDGAALTGSAIGTAGTLGLIETAGAGASTALGITGAGSVLNPIGAAAGTFAGAYAGSDWVLGKANHFAANHDLMGGGRTTTEASGDAGQWVDDGVHSLTDWIPGIGHGLGSLVGGPLGAVTAIGSSLVTEAYTGVRAAGSGIARGAGWLKDKIFGEDVDVDAGAQNKAQATRDRTLDAQIMGEERAELYGRGDQNSLPLQPHPHSLPDLTAGAIPSKEELGKI